MLRAQVRDIAHQVAQFEERLKINDLLNEIRSDLRHRVQNIKTVLGEENIEPEEEEIELKNNPLIKKTNELISPLKIIKKKYLNVKRYNKINNPQVTANNDTEINSAKSVTHDKRWKMLSMTNKTPFWNEHSQVYQVIFFNYKLIKILFFSLILMVALHKNQQKIFKLISNLDRFYSLDALRMVIIHLILKNHLQQFKHLQLH